MNRIALLCLGGLALAGAPVRAQISMPNINAPKQAAQKAAAATNANISEQTGQAVPTRGAPAAATPAPAPRSVPASTPAARPAPASAQPPRSGPGSVPAVPVPTVASAVPPVTREIFEYGAEGRRDPFYSLILTEDLRPLLSDLKLVGVLYETSGRRSVAIFRDIQTAVQYRVGQGQALGRMRVAAIRPKGVVFTIDEFGLSRQDSLMLTDTTRVMR